jgi:predicted phosphodiesterase
MKIAVYSDVHGDVEALRRAHAQAGRLGCVEHLCCGDLVDEAQPAAAIVGFALSERVGCVRGNHERWLLQARREGRYRHPLPPLTAAFIESLPPSRVLRMDGVRVAILHGRPGSDLDGLYEGDLCMAVVRGLLAEAECDVLLAGHTHQALAVHHPGGGLVANPGALGRPPFVQTGPVALVSPTGETRVQESPPSASGTFGVLDIPERRFRLHDLNGRIIPDASREST